MGGDRKSPRCFRKTSRVPVPALVGDGVWHLLKTDKNTYTLAETGRKILAPTYEGEKEEGIKKALFTPSVLSRFYTDYNGSPLPTDDLFPNVLETRYGVPRNRTAEAIEIIKENARFAGALVKRTDGKDGLEFSDVAFPVVKRPLPESGNGEHVDLSAEMDGSADAPAETDWAKTCFVITPIGSEDSDQRKHSDTILKHLLQPVLSEFGIEAIRADKIAKPGIITKQVIEYIAYSGLCGRPLVRSATRTRFTSSVFAKHSSFQPFKLSERVTRSPSTFRKEGRS